MSFKMISIAAVFSLTLASAGQPIKEEFDIQDYQWLTGSWQGTGFGGTTEEIWSPPSEDGKMMGLFRLTGSDGSVNVYQFFLLDKTGLKIKHFTSQLVGWEEKESTTDFKMISFTKDHIQLEGLTYTRKSKNEMEVRLEMNNRGKIEVETFTQRRKN